MLPVPTFRITSAAVARLARYGGRMELTHFNDLPEAEAIEVVSVWARVPAWAEAVAGTRPFASVDELDGPRRRLRALHEVAIVGQIFVSRRKERRLVRALRAQLLHGSATRVQYLRAQAARLRQRRLP